MKRREGELSNAERGYDGHNCQREQQYHINDSLASAFHNLLVLIYKTLKAIYYANNGGWGRLAEVVVQKEYAPILYCA